MLFCQTNFQFEERSGNIRRKNLDFFDLFQIEVRVLKKLNSQNLKLQQCDNTIWSSLGFYFNNNSPRDGFKFSQKITFMSLKNIEKC